MNGRNHLAAGAAVGADMALAAAYAGTAIPAAGALLAGALSPFEHYAGAAAPIGCAAAAALYVLGTVLPDIDNGGTASRWLHFSLPLAHRGWTHSIWPILAILAASVLGGRKAGIAGDLCWPLRYLALGMLAHDLLDGLSVAGWAALYPLGRWRNYKGTIMKRGWTPGLYSSARPGSENVAACAIIVSSMAFWGFMAYVMLFRQ